MGKIEDQQKFPHIEYADISLASNEEKKELAKIFGEGSIGLELCLNALWTKELYTNSCCKGMFDHDEEFDVAHIQMLPHVDLFSFLSEELLDSPNIGICYGYLKDNEQSIYIAGTIEQREKYLIQLATCVLSEKTTSKELIQKKIKKYDDFQKWFFDTYYFMKYGMSEKEYTDIYFR